MQEPSSRGTPKSGSPIVQGRPKAAPIPLKAMMKMGRKKEDDAVGNDRGEQSP